jgi:streptogramin lyase
MKIARAALVVTFLAAAALAQSEPGVQRFEITGPLNPGAVAVDAQGTAWVAGGSSLLRVQNGVVTAITAPHSMYGDVLVTGMHVWTVGDRHVQRYDIAAGTFTTIFTAAEPFPRRISRIVAGPDGNVWFSHGNQLHRVLPNGQSTAFPIAFPYISDIAVSGPAIWLAGVENIAGFGGVPRLIRFDPFTGTSQQLPLARPVSLLAALPDGGVAAALRFGSENTVFRLDANGTVISTVAGPARIANLRADGNGVLWMLGELDRLYRLSGRTLTTYVIATNATCPTTRFGLAIAANGRVWLTQPSPDAGSACAPNFGTARMYVIVANPAELIAVSESHVAEHDIPALSPVALALLAATLAAVALIRS